MHLYQIQVFFEEYKKKNKVPLISPLKVSEEWLELQKNFKEGIPEEGTRFALQEEVMKEFSKWYISQNPSFGLGAAPQTEKKEEKVVATKQEQPTVIYNIYDF